MQDQIIINNNLISYSQFGTGERTVLFLHGWRSQKEVWGSVIRKLLVKNNQLPVYSVDLPGFGGSPASSKVFSVQDYAEVVKGFIERLVRQPADKNIIIIGHSFGGRVGIKFSSMYPELVKKLVLVDSAGFVTKNFKKDFFRLLSKIAKPFFKFLFSQGLRKKIYQFIGAEDYLATPELRETFLNTINEDLTEDMKKITCPTLIISGENDRDTPVDFGKRMNSLILNSKFIILPGSGHFSFLDQPEEFVKELTKFISL